MTLYRLAELLDLDSIQKMANAHYQAAGMPIGIIDAVDGSVLVGVGWQDICVKFHRVHPVSNQRCLESDNYIKDRLVEGQACQYKCKNGMLDIGVPIIVEGQHLATMFLGQFFYEEELPEREFFVRQALELGFDPDEYLKALDLVPRFCHEKVNYILEYNMALVSFISDLASQSLHKFETDRKVFESERRFHAIFDHTYDFLGLLSVDGRLMVANKTSLNFYGITESDVVGNYYWETPWWGHSSELQEKVRLGVIKAAKGEFVRFEVTHIAKDGLVYNFDFSLKPVMDENGMVVFLIPEGRDITERKKTEEALQQSEHFVQTLMDAILNPIFSKDVNGVYRSCNAAFESYLGFSKSQIIGKSVFDLAPPELAERYHQMDMDLLQKGGGQVYESKVRYADGSLHDVIFNKATYKNADGSLGGLVGVMLDITERKKSEEALRHSQMTLQKAQETAHLGVWEWDVQNNNIHCSDELYRIHGLEPGSKIPADPAFGLVHPDDRRVFHDGMESVLAGAAIPFIEYRIQRPDGEVRNIYSSAELFRDVDGNPVRIVGIAYDITEHKKLEDQLRQAQKMEAIGTLAGGVAHDFNNILTAIIGYSSILKMRISPDSPLKGYVEEILGASERAASLTGSLLAFSRKQVINLRPVCLNEIVRGISNLLKRVIGEDIEFNSVLCGEELVVLADTGQIEQVLMNLAANARDSMPHGGLLSITTERIDLDGSHGYMERGSYALLSVSDTGAGMDEATSQRIFEPFFTTKEIGKGTGLGLSMVYGIIKQHNGEIYVYSEPGNGTIFRVYLKLLDDRTEQPAIATAIPVTGGSETILLAEDDIGVRTFFKGVLEEYGYRVIVALDGEDAIAKYSENRDSIQLLIFDLIMPKKNGKDAYNEIVRIGGQVPVVFSSGYTADIIHKKGIVEEGISLITKPVSPSALLLKIRDVLDRAMSNHGQ